MSYEIKIGATDRTLTVFIPDSASTDGSGKTGLVAANLTVSYTRVETDNDVVVTDVTSSLNNLAALTTAHTDWGLLEVSSTLAPGLYRLDIADAVVATGAWEAVVYVMVTTSAASASPIRLILVPEDPYTGVNTSMFNGTAATASGGRPEVNTTHAAGTAWGSGAITAASIAADAITAAKIADGAIDAATFAAGAITATVIATGAIDADAIADGAIDAGAIAADAITAAKIADGAIDAATFSAGAINAAAIASDAITDAKVAADVTIASVTGAVGSVTGNVGGNVTGSVGSLAAQAKADVNAEIVDALATDTYAEPGQGAPAATATLAAKINYLFKAWRNKKEQTSTTFKLYDDAGTTVDQKQTVSDDATTYTRGEVVTGP